MAATHESKTPDYTFENKNQKLVQLLTHTITSHPSTSDNTGLAFASDISYLNFFIVEYFTNMISDEFICLYTYNEEYVDARKLISLFFITNHGRIGFFTCFNDTDNTWLHWGQIVHLNIKTEDQRFKSLYMAVINIWSQTPLFAILGYQYPRYAKNYRLPVFKNRFTQTYQMCEDMLVLPAPGHAK